MASQQWNKTFVCELLFKNVDFKNESEQTSETAQQFKMKTD